MGEVTDWPLPGLAARFYNATDIGDLAPSTLSQVGIDTEMVQVPPRWVTGLGTRQ